MSITREIFLYTEESNLINVKTNIGVFTHIKNFMEYQTKSRFVTYLSLLSIVAAVFMIFENISTLTMLNSLENSQEYRMAEQMLPSLSISPTETVFEIILQMLGIVASISMFKRLNWGRVMYISILTTLTVMGIITSIFSYLSLTEFMKGYGAETSMMLFVFGNIIAIGINVYLAWRLTRKEIQEEFIRQ